MCVLMGPTGWIVKAWPGDPSLRNWRRNYIWLFVINEF